MNLYDCLGCFSCGVILNADDFMGEEDEDGDIPLVCPECDSTDVGDIA